MIFSAVRKEMNMSNNLDRNTSQEFQPIVISSEMTKQSPGSRKHKYEEENEEGISNAAKCQRSNSLGSYFHPIVPEIESSVKASELNFNELEIVDDPLNSLKKQPESVFQFVNSVESDSMSKNHRSHTETSESKFTSNIADDHALFCNTACDDLNSDPRFFQSQSAPAMLLTCDDDVRSTPHTPHTPQNTTSTTHSAHHISPHPSSESAAKSNKVNIHPGFEYKLLGFSSADHNGSDQTKQYSSGASEKKELTISTNSTEEWNNDDFDALTTGDSSLSGSSRRSAAPSRSSFHSHSSSHSYSDKVSTHSDDTYTTHSRSTRTHSTGYRSDSARSPRRHSRSNNGYNSNSRSYDRSESGQYSSTAYTTYSTRTTHTAHSTYSTYSTSAHATRRRSSSFDAPQVSSSVRGVYQTTSSMYSGVYSTGDTGESYSTSHRSPTPPRSTPPRNAASHLYNSGNTTDSTDYSDSLAMQPYSSSLSSSHIYAYPLKTVPASKPVNFRYYRSIHYCDLPLEWWERTEHCKEAKLRHTDRIDHMCGSRESLVLKTTLWRDDIVLEPNMFPYYTPYGVEHYTLWSIDDMSHQQIVSFVDRWLYRHMPQVRRWQYDDNSGERSIDLFHVHVFIETAPYTYAPRDNMLYVPPHALAEEGRSAESAIVL